MTRINQSTVRRAFQLTAALLLSSISAAQTTHDAAHGSSVLAQVRPATSNTAQVKVPLGGTMVMDDRGPTCCPAVMSGTFSQYFRYHQLGGKNINQSYGLEFLSTFNFPGTETIPQTLTLDQQMMPFAFYIGSSGAGVLPAGHVPNSVILLAEIREVLPPNSNAVPTVADWNGYGSSHLTSAGPHAVRAWWSGVMPPSTNPYNVWDGAGGNNGFHTEYMDGHSRLAPNYLLPNHTYMMQMTLVLAYKKTPNDDTWFYKPINCSGMRGFHWWKISENNLKTTGAPGQTQIQFNEVK